MYEELVTKVEDVNSADQLGWTPLMHAVHNGHTLLAWYLLSHGAQASLSNHHGITSFTIAVLGCDEELLKTLYDRLLPELRQQESNMALLVACANGSYNTVKWLLQNTLAQVNFISPIIGVTPFMLVAMASGDCEIAQLLLDSGADPDITSALGQNVSEIALATGNHKLFLLIDRHHSPMSRTQLHFERVESTEHIDPMFTSNQMYLDIRGNAVLKNSPARPVFKNDNERLSTKTEVEKLLLSPSMRSVFLRSCQQRFSCENDGQCCAYNLAAIATPRRFDIKTPSKSKKRKLTAVNGISSWFKKVTKKRSKSLADEDDYDDLNIQQNGVDFLKLLKDLGLEEFYPIFKNQELDMWTFLSLTVQDLAAMGIDKASSQLRILAGIQKFRTTQI